MAMLLLSPRTGIVQLLCLCAPARLGAHLTSGPEVVRSFFRDDDVVHVALAQALGGDPDEPRLRPELLDALAARVAHAAAEAADELVEDGRERSAVRHATLDALGDELLVGRAGLTVAVAA